jgi:hypothetical protein
MLDSVLLCEHLASMMGARTIRIRWWLQHAEHCTTHALQITHARLTYTRPETLSAPALQVAALGQSFCSSELQLPADGQLVARLNASNRACKHRCTNQPDTAVNKHYQLGAVQIRSLVADALQHQQQHAAQLHRTLCCNLFAPTGETMMLRVSYMPDGLPCHGQPTRSTRRSGRVPPGPALVQYCIEV